MSSPYSRIWVYHTKHHMYLVGSHRASAMFGVLRINRHDGAQLQAWPPGGDGGEAPEECSSAAEASHQRGRSHQGGVAPCLGCPPGYCILGEHPSGEYPALKPGFFIQVQFLVLIVT